MNFRIEWIYDDDPELRLRLQPLRDQWEARGPGMLRRLQATLPWLSPPEQVAIQLVQPLRGGGGKVISATRIEFEAVLANRHHELPEVLRLTWLMLCAASGSEPESDTAIAFIPAILAAAEFVELARCDEATVNLALKNWLEPAPQPSIPNLYAWWEKTADEASTMDRSQWLASIRLW